MALAAFRRTLRGAALSLFVVTWTAIPLARAASPVEAAAHGRRPVPHAKPESVHSALPEADVQLALEAPTPRGRWTFRVVNRGSIPVRLVADARVLSFDVTPLSARHPVHCELPSDMRPQDDLERAIVLPPNRTYSESFESRLFCFSGAQLDALAADSIVVAHLGWRRSGTAGPKALAAIDGVEPEVASRGQIDAPPIALRDEVLSAIWSGASVDQELDSPRLKLVAPATVDAPSVDDIVIPLTLVNEGSRPQNVRFRPDALGFDVARPWGTLACTWPVMPAAPTRELFTTVARKQSARLEVLLGSYCEGTELDQGGLFVVWPWLDTRSGDAPDVGFPTFVGDVGAAHGTYVRLHRGREPERSITPGLSPPLP